MPFRNGCCTVEACGEVKGKRKKDAGAQKPRQGLSPWTMHMRSPDWVSNRRAEQKCFARTDRPINHGRRCKERWTASSTEKDNTKWPECLKAPDGSKSCFLTLEINIWPSPSLSLFAFLSQHDNGNTTPVIANKRTHAFLFSYFRSVLLLQALFNRTPYSSPTLLPLFSTASLSLVLTSTTQDHGRRRRPSRPQHDQDPQVFRQTTQRQTVSNLIWTERVLQPLLWNRRTAQQQGVPFFHFRKRPPSSSATHRHTLMISGWWPIQRSGHSVPMLRDERLARPLNLLWPQAIY